MPKGEIYAKLYRPGYIEENKKAIWGASPSEHSENKWVVMWSAWSRFDDCCRRGKYCDPDAFNMHIYTDWHGYGMQEILDNAVSVNSHLGRQ